MSLVTLALGLALGVGAALAAHRLGALTRSGAVAASLIGALTFGFGGVLPAVLMIVFFASSSALSRFGAAAKANLRGVFEKDARRDGAQVLANGGPAALLAVAYGLTREPLALAGLAGALAAVNADTWATELGVLACSRPIRISDGRTVERGTSGAITPEGSAAAAAGAVLIGALAGAALRSASLAAAVSVGGFAGAVFDSLLGATLQGIFECPTCGRETERHPRHTCGTPTRRIRGWGWLRNDGVNLAASVAGACVAGWMWARIG